MKEHIQPWIGLRWRQLSSGTANRQIFGAAVIVGGATVVVSLTSITRDLALAASFGTSDAQDAFLIAVSLPTFVVHVFAGSSALALVPAFVQEREQEGAVAAQHLLSGLMVLSIGFLILATILLAFVSPIFLPLIASGFDPAKVSLSYRLFYLLLPTIVLGGLAMMWGSILNAGERFALAAFAPALVPLTTVVALLVGGTWGIESIVFGMIGGYALQLCLLGWGLTRQGVALRPHWYGMSKATRQTIGQYLPLVAGVALIGSTMMVDQALAATLDPGSVARFTYGTKVVVFIVGLGAGALGTAILPYSSKMVAAADWVQVRQTIWTYSRLTLLVTVPLTGVLVIFSEPIIELVFQRGAFTRGDTALVARVQSLYALQIPFTVLAILCTRLLSSLGANHVLLWSAAVSVPVNVAFGLVLSRILGVAGIALATTLMYVATFCFLSLMLRRRLLEREA